MKRKIITIACLLVSFLLLFSAAAFAAAPEGEGPAVWIEEQTVTAGDHFSFFIRTRDLENVGTLSLSLIYDATQFEFYTVSAQSMISGQITSTNTQTDGAVKLDFISLDGVSGSGNLWRVTLRVKSTAAIGSHTVTLAVGEAYNTALDPLDIAAGNATITVNERSQSLQNVYFYPSCSQSSLKVGEQSTLTFYSHDLQGLAAADFEVEYDHTLLRLDEVTLGEKMTAAENAVYSVNDQSPGYVKVNYVAPNGITGGVYPVLSLKFTALQNVDTSTTIKFKPTNIYDVNLNSMSASSSSTSLSFYKSEVEIDLPDFVLSEHEGLEEVFSLELTAPAETGLAAADFVFNFDPTMLKATSVERLDSSHLMFFNIDNEEGKITVSFIDENGIEHTGAILRIFFDPTGLNGGNTTVSFVGKNMVDADFNTIEADFLGGEVILHKHGVAATCTDDEICSVTGCSKVLAERLGHDPIIHSAQAPTCTEMGWNEYETCSRCDHSTYVAIPENGHSFGKWIEVTAPTCTTDGTERRDCGVCDYYEKLPTCTEIGWNEYVRYARRYLRSLSCLCSSTPTILLAQRLPVLSGDTRRIRVANAEMYTWTIT